MFNNMTAVVKNLLILNVIMFLAQYIIGTRLASDLLALHYPASEKFLPVQIVTHFFMHDSRNLMHIFFNMFALVMFGSILETLWGAGRFLYFYFFCAFGAAILHMGFSYYEISQLQSTFEGFQANPDWSTYMAFVKELPYFTQEQVDVVNSARTIPEAIEAIQLGLDNKMNIPIVGASGAIFGLLLAFGMYFPNQELMLIFFPVPVKAKYFIPVLMVIELFLGVNQFSWDNIAHFAHLGGALSGFLLILYWRKFGSRFDKTRYK